MIPLTKKQAEALGRRLDDALAEYRPIPAWASKPEQPERKPIVALRSGMTYYRDGFGYKWNWTCRLCYRTSGAACWDLAYESATRHARNHHRSQ